MIHEQECVKKLGPDESCLCFTLRQNATKLLPVSTVHIREGQTRVVKGFFTVPETELDGRGRFCKYMYS